MEFSLDRNHYELRRRAREFCDREIAPHIRAWDRAGCFPEGMVAKLAAEGFLGLCIPGSEGGRGEDFLALGLLCEELERADTAFRVLLSVHLGLNSLALLQWGTEEQKRRYLLPQARGEKLAAFGLTEPEAGSDVAALRCSARREGDAYILNGDKSWIGFAGAADHFLIFARTGPGPGSSGLSAFIVERGSPGLRTSSIEHKLGGRAGNTGGVSLRDVAVATENRLGEEGDGFKIAMSALDNGRYTVAAGAVGLIEACLEASARFARRRRAFGRAIGRQQLVQQKIAEMVAGRDIGRLLWHKVGWLKNQGRRCTREVSLAKWINCRNAFAAADAAVQIHGARGYSDEYPVERYLRNARGARIYEGTEEIHQVLQAEYALGYREDKPLKRKLPEFGGAG